jgi:Cof subfamily protein (haloacid dehalogenase superfamily)
MIQRCKYDALLIDLDGTLLDGRSEIRPRNLAALRALSESGVHVMIATGRSTVAALQVVADLELETPMLIFNGAAIYCPREGRLIEERVLSNRVVERALALGRERGYLMVAQQALGKFGTTPRTPDEQLALRFFHGLETVEPAHLPAEYVIRIIYFSGDHASSEELAREVSEALGAPLFLTDYPLRLLVSHRTSPLQVVDVHPPSRGKAEGIRFLQEHYGVPRERIVAVGDASNDIAMLRVAGLGVAMEGCCERTHAAADRVIGHHDSDAIAELVGELFGIRV